MKYSEILHFEPLTDLIQLDKLSEPEYRMDVVKNFVYPDYFINTTIPTIVNNLKFGARDKKGIQIIGNYGTGKSHLMSLVSLVAEDKTYLDAITNPKAKEILEPIAGKFLTLRFEMQTDRPLWEVMTFNIQRFINANGIDYKFDLESPQMYGEQLDDMMALFDEKYPEKGLLIIVDEMLSYLQNHADRGMLNHDLQVLQTFGQQCAKCRMGFMFGVQELIYKAKEFQFASQMLLKVKDRYVDLTIRKEEVAYVVQNRLLQKNGNQKQLVRQHLQKFMPFFSDLHDRMEEYVELFPVHPSYFDNFQNIRLGRSHREILRTLSNQFELIKDNDVPSDNPGLITYDSYMERLLADPSLLSIPDFQTVSDTIRLVHDKIESNFDGPRKRQRPLAKRIANAAAIKLLQGEINKKNGIRIPTLVDDLCITSDLAEDKQFLVDYVNSTARLIIAATSGQYFDFNPDNEEYYLRTEGGVNFDQQIVQYAETMPDSAKDASFFRFLVEVLGKTGNPYRTGFHIYQHELEWRSHKVTRDGYIFMGSPNEKSTTQPKQYFYMIFMPIFQESKKQRNCESDEVYFVMDDLSDTFKTLIAQYGAAYTLWSSADSAQKTFYKTKYEDLLTKTRREFEACYLRATKVYFKDQAAKALASFQLPGQGASKMEIFDSVASAVFEEQFTEQLPKYPAFVYAQSVISHDNMPRYIRGAFAKILRPGESNKDGEAILAGLGCYKSGEITVEDSIYAQTVIRLMSERDAAMVVNKDELLEYLPKSENIWRSKDYQIEAVLEFTVLAVMVSQGLCEIRLNSGDTIDANSLDKITRLQPDDYYNFASIKKPHDVNKQIVKELTKKLCGQDLSNQLDNQMTYQRLTNAAKTKAEDCAVFLARELKAINVAGIEIISEIERSSIDANISGLKGFCSRVSQFTSEARLRSFPFDLDTVRKQLANIDLMEEIRAKIKLVRGLESEVTYLNQAIQYIAEGTPLMQEVTAATTKLADILSDPNEAQVENYILELKEAKKHYIEYYLERYYKFCISDIDNTEKMRLLNSAEYKVCQKLSECILLNSSVWTTWRSMIFELRSADPRVEAMLANSPYANFNPLQKLDKKTKTIRELGTDLKDIYAMWINELKDYIQQEDTQAQLRMMDTKSQEFLDSFVAGLTVINDENSAKCLLELLAQLSAGFERVDISVEDIVEKFTKPMTIAEAKGVFDLYIERQCGGKDRNKVRIVIKK